MSLALIVLAAGKGTRMRSADPKVLHKVAGVPMVIHALNAAAPLAPARRLVVVGHGGAAVRAQVQAHDASIEFVEQTEQLGTGHAVDQARAALADFDGDVAVLLGDTPFISPDTLSRIRDRRAEGSDLVVLGFEAADPGKYGRLVAQGDRLERIVEAKDATPEELAIRLCNSGVICADRALMFDLIAQLNDDNASGEYYLTDIIGLANDAGRTCSVVVCDEAETLGVNSRIDLAAADGIFQARARQAAMAAGVTLQAPDTVYFSYDTQLGQDVIVEPNVVFGLGVRVEDGVTIRAFSHLEGCHVAAGATVGPYARLRPGSTIGAGARVGNFVETKNADIAAGAKLNHLSYIGDAEVGAEANIGAGTITCNYDGVFKHRTEIGAGAFIGSNASLVAPVSVGAGAMVGAGSVVTRDVPDQALAVTRAEQKILPDLARKLRERRLAMKAKK
ncbi:bifunctional UDP-N-acetylglucosamine diphosphorylase/glucosamine-1-phosphate N-acetyltransferase GlmU [Tropicibacter sp. R16_0]|uniref:bifunctional UDP-N-acetylglucosamine diphosphorylase/glucosamine-1-phosphate N-acetyltransferase GlmU n=1 Tax=Tropicibacter sp. R16_0 TaxID=2821102 RepID=UPI001AD97549|nr:bifunctional UDP-N-acetylglucosamine diphosphorylase/glucosamine-1-phosphate N-acetyltransferase GlmU [Tropicibacter sp. R16_0]MBO9453370.1 bifunctional UDP-N-acetylglucosamine diphosphorylase/glucosamine-1-phosphate N-acetyltransferase GlmU [Tropicibacter sp. R16_0]